MAAVPSIGRATAVAGPDSAPEAHAVQLLYERHSRRIFSYCLYRLGKREEAEDAVQTTFLYALGGLRRGVVPAAEAAWLLKIAQNVCLSRWHAARRRRAFEFAREPQALEEVLPAPQREQDDLIPLEQALARLPEQQRRAILLREWHGLSYREIEQQLGLSQAAVEALIFRARRSLADELRGEPKAKRRRLVRGIDVGSLLGALKSALGGAGAVKIAAGVAALAGAGVLVGGSLQHRSQPVRLPGSVSTETLPAAPTVSDALPGAPTVSAETLPAGSTVSDLLSAAGSAEIGAETLPFAPSISDLLSAAPTVSGTPPSVPSVSDALPEAPSVSTETLPSVPSASDPVSTETLPSVPSVSDALPEAPSVSTETLPSVPSVSDALPEAPSVSTETLPSVPSVSDALPEAPSVSTETLPSVPSVGD